MGARGQASEILLSPPPTPGITDVPHTCIWLYVGSQVWDSGLRTCSANAFSSEPPPVPHLESLKKMYRIMILPQESLV